jgi:hypothetical protein
LNHEYDPVCSSDFFLFIIVLKVCETRVHFGTDSSEMSARTSSSNNHLRSSGCLLMDGVSSIEVDTGGIFLSVPVSTEVISTGGAHPLSLDDPERPEKRSSRILKKGAKLFVINGKKDRKQLVNDSRMTLHIPASEAIAVTCTQPASLIISIPLQRAASPYSSSKDRDRDRAGSNSDASPHNREGSSRTVGSSSQDNLALGIAIAPWSYIQSHDEKAMDVTDDDEVEASDFARNLSSLERYIAALPPHAVDVKISISCAHRLERDALVLAIRALAAQQATATTEKRRSAFPWSENTFLQAPRSGEKSGFAREISDSLSVTTGTTQSPASHVLSPTATPDVNMDHQQMRQLHDSLADHAEKEVQKTTHCRELHYPSLLLRIFFQLTLLYLFPQSKFSEIRTQLKERNDALQQRVKELEGICDHKDEELSALEEICAHKEVLQRLITLSS